MFPIVAASFLLSLAFGLVAFELPQIQSLMLVGGCVAATAFLGSLEAWSTEESSDPRSRRPFERGADDGASE